MSKINISGRSEHLRLHNIPLRTDLGSRLRAALFAQKPMPRALLNTNFNSLEMRIAAQYAKQSKSNDDQHVKQSKSNDDK